MYLQETKYIESVYKMFKTYPQKYTECFIWLTGLMLHVKTFEILFQVHKDYYLCKLKGKFVSTLAYTVEYLYGCVENLTIWVGTRKQFLVGFKNVQYFLNRLKYHKIDCEKLVKAEFWTYFDVLVSVRVKDFSLVVRKNVQYFLSNIKHSSSDNTVERFQAAFYELMIKGSVI